ncbi:hypothetical protein B0T17DRAFT_613767 [Bombardia bombarda]|uniref:Alpha/beta hydrolase fold-3 domain-containing protein n=1 Tax=Bombardia bombarda TaxID=252184 RepID=A0AA39XNF0_9PEZI|nr:hypothetical protein B0T17DRAFT_613767 [Bombardia bombarda]
MTASLLTGFDRADVVYRMLGNMVNPSTAILIRRSVKITDTADNIIPLPVLVHFHGGALVRGTNLDPAMIPRWVVELAAASGAILVSPSYRLVPESSTGGDTLDDIACFWDLGGGGG